MTQSRFVVDRDAYQGPSPTLNATPIATIRRQLATPNLAWDFLTLAEPERWDEFLALADMPRAAEADFVVGGRRYGLFRHDYRQVPIDALMELWTERALAQDFALPPAQPDDVLVLSQQDFADAVRQGSGISSGPTCWRGTRCCAPASSAGGPRTPTPPRSRDSCTWPSGRFGAIPVTTSAFER